MRLARAMIFVADLPRAECFYVEALGFRAIEETRLANWIELESCGFRLSLHEIPPHLARDIEIASQPRPRESTPIKLVFETEDLEAEKKRLEALGITPQDRPWGGFDIADPEGNIIGIRGL